MAMRLFLMLDMVEYLAPTRPNPAARVKYRGFFRRRQLAFAAKALRADSKRAPRRAVMHISLRNYLILTTFVNTAAGAEFLALLQRP